MLLACTCHVQCVVAVTTKFIKTSLRLSFLHFRSDQLSNVVSSSPMEIFCLFGCDVGNVIEESLMSFEILHLIVHKKILINQRVDCSKESLTKTTS